MSLVQDTRSTELARGAHVGDLRLRRLRAGELDEAARLSVEAHTQTCDACRTKLARLEEEQRTFSDAVPFARFSAGVAQARRSSNAREAGAAGAPAPTSAARGLWKRGLLGTLGLGLAAAAGLVLVARTPGSGLSPSTTSPAGGERGPGGNATKGAGASPGTGAERGLGGNATKGAGTSALVRIVAPGGDSRVALPGPSPDPAAEPVELLRSGEQLRIGYRAANARHLVALTIDDAGSVTPLYPEAGGAALVAASREPTFLPEGVTLTGVGRERLFVVLAAQPLSLTEVSAAAATAHAKAAGDLARATHLALPGEPDVTTWLFQKP